MKQQFLFKMPTNYKVLTSIPKGSNELFIEDRKGIVTCRVCGRELKNLKSRFNGVGSMCAKKKRNINQIVIIH